MDLSATWADNKNNNTSQTSICNKQPYDVTQKRCKGSTQWAFLPLRKTIKTNIKIKTNNLKIKHKHLQEINPMVLCDP